MPTAGTNGIVEITTQIYSTDVPRDVQTNTFGVNTTSASVTPTQWQALADAVKSFHFATTGTRTLYGTNGGKVLVYNRADATPRPEMGASTFTPGTWTTAATLPRQISIVLSFYAGRNLKRKRGRIYMPSNPNWATAWRPTATDINNVLQYGVQLNAMLIALSPSWGLTVHSKADNMDWVIDHFWVNDVYDTQRRRSPKETTRVHNP